MRNELPSLLAGLFSANLFNGRQGEIITRTARLDAGEFDFQAHIPNTKSPENLPVIVFLHGIRERGAGGFIQKDGMFAAIIKQYLKPIPAIVLLPQCRPAKYWSDPVMDKMVISAVEQTAGEFNADANRIYLVGVSMGGYGVWHFASQYPQKFAALVSICGGSPVTKGDRFSSIAEKIGKTPAWLFHGAEDTVVPVSESREMVKALKERNNSVKYNEYANVGHNVWLNALAEKDLLPWLLAQNLNAK
jgi:predicted peptidase